MDIFNEQLGILKRMKSLSKALTDTDRTTGNLLTTDIIKMEELVAKTKRAYHVAQLNVTNTKDAVM